MIYENLQNHIKYLLEQSIKDQVFAILDMSFQGDIKFTDHKHKSTIVSDIAQIWLTFITMCTSYIG